MRQIFGDAFFYILYFQEPGVADAELGAIPRDTMRRMLAGATGARTRPPSIPSTFANDGRGLRRAHARARRRCPTG